MPGQPFPPPPPPGLPLDRRTLLAGGAAVLFSGTRIGVAAAAAPGDVAPPRDRRALAAAFDAPPAEAGLGTYWYWLDGAVTRAGITADLEAMHAGGITTAMLFAIGAAPRPPLVVPPADALTPVWWALVDHAVAEADRLGMTIAMNICDGWATASGPWITPDLSMQKVTWSELRVAGGTVRPRLPDPPRLRDYYRDTAVFAMPWPEALDATSAVLLPAVTTSLPVAKAPLARLLDPANAADVFDTTQGGWIAFAFDAPFTLRSVTVRTPSPWGYSPGVYRAANAMAVEASDDGVHFRPIGALEYPQHGWQTDFTTLTHALPETRARVFRFRHTPLEPGDYRENYDFAQDVRLRLFSLELSSRPVIHQIAGKTAEQWSIARRTDARDVPDAACVRPDALLDLTDRLRDDGTLDWTAPPGRWRIVRIGATTNGRENSAAGGAQGLEVDRFDRAAVTLQFDRWFGAAIDRVGAARAGRVLHAVHVDSWEASGQNWSPRFLDRFRALRGYDLRPWLPVMAGVPIASADASEAVLHDIRQTIAELTQSEFFATVARLAHARGCRFTAEPASPTYAVDGLRWAEAADMPMGEFWFRTPRNDKPTDVADAVSGGHIYGKRVIGAESFTENDIRWDEHPALLKPLGDRHYCRGINRLMLHVYTAQPFLDRAPGMTLNGIGTMFSRTQTWWTQARGWFDHMRRCQAVLQQGRTVADVAVFIGEEIPSRARLAAQLDRDLPPGYVFDSVDRTVLVQQATVDAGTIVLAGGARYRLLILPDDARYSPAFLAALLRLVEAGATVCAAPPVGPIGLDRKGFADIADRLWRTRGASGETRLGRGRVIWGRTLGDILADVALAPDLACGDAPIDWTHRSGDGWDAWFVVNTQDRPLDAGLSLRTTADDIAFWHPDTGRRRPAPVWRRAGARTEVPVTLAPYESLLVVAGAGAGRRHVACVEAMDAGLAVDTDAAGTMLRARTGGTARLALADGRAVARTVIAPPPPRVLPGPWTLRFAGWRAPKDVVPLSRPVAWSTLAEPRLRHHAGSGTYRTTVSLARADCAPDLRLLLDLGSVREIAEVAIDGVHVATLWQPPFVVDLTDVLRPGPHVLDVTVTNVWHNRLVGDRALPPAERTAWVYPPRRGGKDWLPAADAALIPAGLIGPVRLVFERIVRVPLA